MCVCSHMKFSSEILQPHFWFPTFALYNYMNGSNTKASKDTFFVPLDLRNVHSCCVLSCHCQPGWLAHGVLWKRHLATTFVFTIDSKVYTHYHMDSAITFSTCLHGCSMDGFICSFNCFSPWRILYTVNVVAHCFFSLLTWSLVRIYLKSHNLTMHISFFLWGSKWPL